MKIVIRNTGKQPIYEQIKEQIKAAILCGALSEGALLPSIRQLARDLKISVITTTRAYGDLEQEGFVGSVPGKGFFVLPRDRALIREEALVEIETQLGAALLAAQRAQITREEFMQMLAAMDPWQPE